MARLDAAIPTGPLVGANGLVTPAWLAFFISLYMRTGGSIGQSSDTTVLEQELAAETEARIAEDNALGASLLAEQEARQVADADQQEALDDEAEARQYADSLLLPTALLASAWAQSNIAAQLPLSDPGGGRPWNNAGVVTVGTVVGHQNYMAAENTTNWWLWQDGVMSILWG